MDVAYHKVNNFHLSNDRYLFMDVFCRNGELILIVPTYNNTETLSITVSDQNYSLQIKKIVNSLWIRTMIYDLAPMITDHCTIQITVT